MNSRLHVITPYYNIINLVYSMVVSLMSTISFHFSNVRESTRLTFGK